MNRKQAEHILDAYVHITVFEGVDEASKALREVIIDAMTTSYPTITLPSTQPFTTGTTPNWINNKPIVTCDAGGVQ